jgi:hypothetical protein
MTALGAVVVAAIVAGAVPGAAAVTAAAQSRATGSATRAATTATLAARALGGVPAQAGSRPHAAAVPVPAGTYALGDSVMLGSRTLLRRRGIVVDAVVSRQFSTAAATLASVRRAGRLPRNVVVHLGTNGNVALADCRALVDSLGGGRRVFLVTAHAPRSWVPLVNRHLRACAKAYAGHRVIVVDWDRAATGHPSWFAADGIHPSSVGRPHYVAVIAAALAAYGI